MEQAQKGRLKAMLFVAIAAILWSTAGLFIKWVSWHPIAIAGARSVIAGIVVLIYWILRYRTLPPLPTGRKLFGAVNYAVLVMLFIGANKLTSAANAILLQFTAPVWVMILASIFLKEPIKKEDFITVIAVFAGMGMFFVGNLSAGNMTGNFLAILSGVAMAVMVVTLKGVKKGSPLEIVFWGNVLTAMIGIPFYGGLSLDVSSVSGILLLGIFQLGIAYIFYANGITNISALEGILIPVLEPLLNPVWVFLFTGEKPALSALAGGVIVVAAVLRKSIKEYEPVQDAKS